MRTSLKDINIFIGDWKEQEDKSLVRDIKSGHPSKVSFPGLPSHATSMKIQKLKIDRGNKQLTIIESNSFEGIPYSDYFRVDTVWKAEEVVSVFMGSTEQCTKVVVTGEVVFVKSTWLRGSIESNTKSELQDVYSSWEEVALQHIKTRYNLLPHPEENYVVTNVHLPSLFDGGREGDRTVVPPNKLSRVNSMGSEGSSEDGFYDCEEGGGGDEGFSGGGGGGRDMKGGIGAGMTDDDAYALLHDVRVRQLELRGGHPLPLRPLGTLYSTPRRGGYVTSRDDGGEGGEEEEFLLSHTSPMHLLTPKQLIELYGTTSLSEGAGGDARGHMMGHGVGAGGGQRWPIA